MRQLNMSEAVEHMFTHEDGTVEVLSYYDLGVGSHYGINKIEEVIEKRKSKGTWSPDIEIPWHYHLKVSKFQPQDEKSLFK